MKVLIVDDDNSSRVILKNTAETYSEESDKKIEICEAEDGLKAYNLCVDGYKSDSPFDLVFLDIMMPHMDGQEFLMQLRDYEEELGIPLGTGTKVVMVTHNDDPQEICTSLSEGAADYLNKPFDRKRIISILSKS